VEDQALTGVSAFLFTQGILGVCVLVLGWVAWRFFTLYTTTQEKRVEEAQAFADTLLATTRSQDATTALLKQLLEEKSRGNH
jgi:predicted negative regulator of RcsB-dependent stress response